MVVTSNAPIRKTGMTQGNVILYRSSDGGQRFKQVLQTTPMLLWEAKLAFDVLPSSWYDRSRNKRSVIAKRKFNRIWRDKVCT